MARQQEGMMAVDEFGKSGPIHGVHTFESSKKSTAHGSDLQPDVTGASLHAPTFGW
jgi:hypothetical protein